jgi:hypothetical protein
MMSGYFLLEIGGVQVKIYNPSTGDYTLSQIPYNVDGYTLASALQKIVGF